MRGIEIKNAYIEQAINLLSQTATFLKDPDSIVYELVNAK